ncbi:MAG TPA: hypothetical protein VGC95_08140, partial [Chitinophagaceae bacterium]
MRWILRSAFLMVSLWASLLIVPTANCADGAGEDWPGFLGLRHNGISGETGLIEKFPTNGPPIVWSKSIGTGYGAPTIRGERLVLH